MQKTPLLGRHPNPTPCTQAELLDMPPGIDAANYPPVRIIEIDLGEALPLLPAINEETGERYQHAWCLVRLHSQPLGVIELDFEDHVLAPERYAQHIWTALQTQINDHLRTDDLPPILELSSDGIPGAFTPACIVAREEFVANAPFVSVVVPTHDRSDHLTSCLHSLLALHYPRYEIIIVDNAPTTVATLELVQQVQEEAAHLHYIREDRPGVSWARNRGIASAKGEIIAFTDDDVVVDAHWLTELVRAFGYAEDVQCTTGAILPLELETPAQCLFERYAAFPRVFKPRIFNMGKHHPRTPLFPFVAGSFGAGANMAFRASFIRHLAGFDPALGGDGPSRNGQDIDTFFNVIIQGHALVYNPAAFLYHQHRRTFSGLRKQVFRYGVGFAAYLTKNICQRPSLLFRLVLNIPRGLFRLLKARSNKKDKSDSKSTKSRYYPEELTRLELRGMLYGPVAYFQTVRLMRKKSPNDIPL
jgi:GT2 family glycosyltransferase